MHLLAAELRQQRGAVAQRVRLRTPGREPADQQWRGRRGEAPRERPKRQIAGACIQHGHVAGGGGVRRIPSPAEQSGAGLGTGVAAAAAAAAAAVAAALGIVHRLCQRCPKQQYQQQQYHAVTWQATHAVAVRLRRSAALPGGRRDAADCCWPRTILI